MSNGQIGLTLPGRGLGGGRRRGLLQITGGTLTKPWRCTSSP